MVFFFIQFLKEEKLSKCIISVKKKKNCIDLMER